MKKQDEEKKNLILDRAFEDVLLDMIEKYPSPEELKGTQKFSAEHENKMQDIIRGAQKREQHKLASKRSRLYRIGINVAAVFGLLCLITTLMAFTVPPVRIALQNYFMTKNEDYIEFEMLVDEDEFENEVYNYPSYIPDRFEIENTMENDHSLRVLFVSESDEFIRLERYLGAVGIKLDVENAEHRVIDVQGKKGQLVVENDVITIVFNTREYSFKIITDVSEEEAVKIAESISEKK